MGASSMIVLIIAGLAFSTIAILVAALVTKGTKKQTKGRTLRMRYSYNRKNLGTIKCRLLFICPYLFNF